MKSVSLAIAVVVSSVCALTLTSIGQDNPSGRSFFRTKQIDGRWWLVDPEGKPFISKGVTTVSFFQDRVRSTGVAPYGEANKAKYGSQEAWREAAAKRLIGWGFNTLGAWSDEQLCQQRFDGRQLTCAPTIDIGAKYVSQRMKGQQAWLHGIFPDVFDPEFEKVAHQVAVNACSGRKDDPRVIGWFTDNELRWGPDWRGKDELLTMFLALPVGAAGRTAAIEMLMRRHGDIAAFNRVWKTKFTNWDELKQGGTVPAPFVRQEVYLQNQDVEREANVKDAMRAAFVGDCEEFLGMIGEKYFRITSQAVRAADPNHLVFGSRFAYVPPKPVVEAAAKYLDVVSFNCYATDPRSAIKAYSAFGKPLIIGEFAFRGKDSGLPNTQGAGPIVETQKDRAAAFAVYVTQGLSEPNLVGYHWFEHCDEPKEGRFDGENSNYGLVNIKDEVYTDLTEEMTRINARAEELHRAPKP